MQNENKMITIYFLELKRITISKQNFFVEGNK
jgi:hypothetical protein